jgi:hypothetical protein
MRKYLMSCLLAFAVGDVSTFTSPSRTFATASYWIEGPDGLVMTGF